MMNMKLLVVVTSPSINHGCFTRRTFWEEKFIGEENFTLGEFTSVNMKNCGRSNVRKHGEVKDSDNYTTLEISLKFISLDKMRITSLEPKDNQGIPGKGLIISLSLKAKANQK